MKRNTTSRFALAPAPPQPGFTLVELLVGSILLLIAGSGAALIVSSSANPLQTSRRIDRLEALIDDDIAAVREISSRFSCCSGACGLSTTGCLAAAAGDDRFYFPLATDASPPAFLEGTNGLCNNGGVGNAFVTTITASAAPSAAFTAAGLSRAVARADASDGRNHLVRLTYTAPANTGAGRVVYVLPPAASWCQ